MEIKIGVRNSSRELVLESTQTPEEVQETVSQAVADGGVLSLTDERGRSVHVPIEALAYLELGPAEVRRVGFGAV
ncbi:MAG: DUF3107 domain-containing protein [Kineosporiaceae bacterium]